VVIYAAKLTTLLEWLFFSHLTICYFIIALTASFGAIYLAKYQAHQQWLANVRIAAELNSAKLVNALNNQDSKAVVAILADINRVIPVSRISLFSRDGTILAQYS
jgi:hypothetical protein